MAGHEQRFPLCALDMPKYTRDKIKVEIPPWLLSDPRLAGGERGWGEGRGYGEGRGLEAGPLGGVVSGAAGV